MRKLILALIGGGIIVSSVSANTFTAEVSRTEKVVMDASYTVIYFRITHTGTTRPIYRVRFYFDPSVYCPSYTSNNYAPEGWSVSLSGYICRNNISGIEFRTTTNPILPGGSLEFGVYLQGPGYAHLPRDPVDMVDSTLQIRAYGSQGNALTYQGSQPSWIRHALDGLMFAAPSAVGIDGEITVTLWIKNNSTQLQSLILPSIPIVTGSGNVMLTAGPYPEGITLDTGEEATFEWRYRATKEGEVYFSGSASNGSASTPPPDLITSSKVTIGDFSCALSVDPEKVGDNWEVNVTMDAFNFGDQILGDVSPSPLGITGSASATLQSGPEPLTASQIPPGSSASFTWTYLINGNPGDTVQFSGYAYANEQGIASTPCTSPVVEIITYPMNVMPQSVTSGATNAKFTYIFGNSGTTNIRRVYIQTNVQNEGTWIYLTGSGYGGYNGCSWTKIEYTDWVRFDAPTVSCQIPPGETGTFYITYSQIPVVTVEKTYTHKGNVWTTSNRISVTTDEVVVVPYTLTLSKNPGGPIPADGTSEYEISASLMNGTTPVEGATVSFSTTAGYLSSTTAVTDSSGIARVYLRAPSSPQDITATVTATYRTTSSSISAEFTGVTGPNLQYIGGTFVPSYMFKGNTYSVKADFRNEGSESFSLTTASYITFSDGVNSYLANLSSPVTVAPGERITLTFLSQTLSPTFTSGLYSPQFYFTDGTTSQVRTAIDAVKVMTELRIISTESSQNPGDVIIVFSSEPGESYEILTKDSFGESFTSTDIVFATGTTAVWIDDGSKTGIDPFSIKERYYTVKHIPSLKLSPEWGGSYCVDVMDGLNHVSLPLIPQDYSIQKLIGNQLTGSTSMTTADMVYQWDPATQSYSKIAWLFDSGGLLPQLDGKWIDAKTSQVSDMTLDLPVRILSRHGNQKFCFAGLVASADNIRDVAGEIQYLEIPYPQAVNIQDSGLYESGASGSTSMTTADMVYLWNPATQRYDKIAWLFDSGGLLPQLDGKWIDAQTSRVSDMILEPGKAMRFIDRPPLGFTWTFPKPYTTPPNE